jgi:hypothetical protein
MIGGITMTQQKAQPGGRMNKLFLVIWVIVGLGWATSAIAQLPSDASVGGQVQFAQAFGENRGSWCYVGQGSSQFQGNATNSVAVISFPEVIYFDGAAYYPLNGQARLTFSSATTGTIRFKFWGTANSITDPVFTGYSETFNGQQYIVSFNIAFPNNCTLPIFAGFEIP